MKHDDQEFLLKSYGAEYDPESGLWNTSVASKYLEYKIAAFFEEHFEIAQGSAICNIGIGAGYWDRYLSYRLNSGSLTSIDRDAFCCRYLALRLENERNPYPVQILHSDVMLVKHLDHSFDLVTMIGSTSKESGLFEQIWNKAIELLKPGGAFFYQTIDRDEAPDRFSAFCAANKLKIEADLLDTNYGYRAQYFKVVRP